MGSEMDGRTKTVSISILRVLRKILHSPLHVLFGPGQSPLRVEFCAEVLMAAEGHHLAAVVGKQHDVGALLVHAFRITC